MHAPETRAEALRLVEEGINDCEISRRLGVPRATIRDWRAPRYVPRTSLEICPRCWKRSRPMTFCEEDYAELLGLYLGDGCISRLGRTHSLRLTFDAAHPKILAEAQALLKRCFVANGMAEFRPSGSGAVVLTVYSRHLPCLFPQHGPGQKHNRAIVLEPWQQRIVSAAPWSLLRGLINSDGCYFTNVTGRYTYMSYAFTNYSADIIELFCAACDRVGVDYRRYRAAVRINRRVSVAAFEQNVGTKG